MTKTFLNRKTSTCQALALGLTALWLVAPGVEAQVEQAWVAQYDGPQVAGISPTDWVTGLVARDGYVYVTGYESAFFGSAYATAKYDYAGQELWVQRLDDGQAQHAEALAVDAVGNVYVTGWQKQFSAGTDVVTLKYGPGGDVLWEQHFSSPGGNNRPNDMALDASGNIYVAGASWVTAQQDFDVLLLKYSSDGTLLWDRTLDNGDGQLDTAYELAIDSNGNAIVAGFTEPNAYLAKYGPTGDLLWQREKVGFSTNDEWKRVEVDAADNIYVLGEISPPGQPNHLWTTKYDPDGSILWEQTYTGAASQSCYAGGLAIMPDGGVVISGQSWDVPNNISIVTIRYAPDGVEEWQRLEKAGYAHTSGDDVAVDAEGRIYVTGYGYKVSYLEDIITLSYSPDGDLLWTQIYANPEPAGSDYPHAMAVDEAANVFVAASSWSSATSNDFTTIMYSQGDFPVVYCTAKTSSAGCVTQVGVSSNTAPTSGANDFAVIATSVQGFKNGILFGGNSGAVALPFSGGILCVNPPTKRSPVQGSGGTNSAACDGSYSLIVNDGSVFPIGLDAGPGNSGWYQYWYRDPANGLGGAGTALSNAVQLSFQ